MVQVRDITGLSGGLLAVTFETEAGERDVALFLHRATEEELSALSVWRPGPQDPALTAGLDEDEQDIARRWAGERGITVEQAMLAFIRWLVLRDPALC